LTCNSDDTGSFAGSWGAMEKEMGHLSESDEPVDYKLVINKAYLLR